MNNVNAIGRSSDLLPFARPSRLLASGQWPIERTMVIGAYSCGTVTDLHRIPF